MAERGETTERRAAWRVGSAFPRAAAAEDGGGRGERGQEPGDQGLRASEGGRGKLPWEASGREERARHPAACPRESKGPVARAEAEENRGLGGPQTELGVLRAGMGQLGGTKRQPRVQGVGGGLSLAPSAPAARVHRDWHGEG